MSSFEYHRGSIRHLGCVNVLVYVHTCDPAHARYRSGEYNYVCRYIYNCRFAFATALK